MQIWVVFQGQKLFMDLIQTSWSQLILDQTLKFQFKCTNSTKQQSSPPRRTSQQLGTYRTPPFQRRKRQIKILNNENSDNSNVISRFRLKSQMHDSCEFECKQDYTDIRLEDQDIVKRSINIIPVCLSQSQEGFQNLTRSQDIATKKPKMAEKQVSSYAQLPQNTLSFGSIKQGILKNSLALNREFMEDKKIKNEILDQIIKNASKNITLKSQEISSRIPKTQTLFLCSNQDGKKAKYQVMDADSQIFYFCSKCSIILLQQGYNIVQISQQPPTKLSETGRRRKEVDLLMFKATDIQSKFKSMIHSVRSDGGYDFEGVRSWLEETYQALIFVLEEMKVRDFQSLEKIRRQVSNKQKSEKAQLVDKYSRLESIKQDLDHLNKTNIFQIGDMQLSFTLQNVSNSLKQLQAFQPQSITVKFQSIDEKLTRYARQVRQNFHNLSESKLDLKEESSIIAKLDRLSDLVPLDRKPFRNLFSEQELSEQAEHTYSTNLFSSDIIEQLPDEDMRRSPKFKKIF